MNLETRRLDHRQPGYVYSVDAHQWDFEQKNVKLGHHVGAVTHPADKIDLCLTKDGIDYLHLRDTSLFAVGGYFHWHDGDVDGIYIEEGARSQKLLQTHHINIVNFEEVGGIVKPYRFTDDNLVEEGVVGKQHHTMLLHFPEVDISNKLVGVVICGELYWLHHDGLVVSFVNEHTLRFNFDKWHLNEKVYWFRKRFGDKHLKLTPYLDNRVKVEEIRKVDFLKRLFKLPQSFLVVIECPHLLELTKEAVSYHQLPKRYFAGKHHYAPLRSSDGRYLPYIPMDERNGFVLATEENRVYPQQNDTLLRDDQPYLNELPVSNRAAEYRLAHFINIKVKE